MTVSAGRLGATAGAPKAAAPATPLLHREATPYYVLLGASTLLLTLGVVMVFSASSVIAFSFMGSSFDGSPEQTAKATGRRSRGAEAISWTGPRCW